MTFININYISIFSSIMLPKQFFHHKIQKSSYEHNTAASQMHKFCCWVSVGSVTQK